MNETLPYFAGLIMILSGTAFYLALQAIKKIHKTLDKD